MSGAAKRTYVARFASVCSYCGAGINPGERIQFETEDSKAEHVGCREIGDIHHEDFGDVDDH